VSLTLPLNPNSPFPNNPLNKYLRETSRHTSLSTLRDDHLTLPVAAYTSKPSPKHYPLPPHQRRNDPHLPAHPPRVTQTSQDALTSQQVLGLCSATETQTRTRILVQGVSWTVLADLPVQFGMAAITLMGSHTTISKRGLTISLTALQIPT